LVTGMMVPLVGVFLRAMCAGRLRIATTSLSVIEIRRSSGQHERPQDDSAGARQTE
jgi:hypothetical protein